MYTKSSYAFQMINYPFYRGEPISQVSRLISIVYAQIDRVLPNGLHDLYICSDVDLEFVRNLLYVTPKHIDPSRVKQPKRDQYPDTTKSDNDFKEQRSLASTEAMKREFQATLFHHKTMWVYEQVRAEIHRRQQARITPEMRALTAAKNSMNQVNQLDILNRMIEAKTKLVTTEIDADGRRISSKRLKDEEQALKLLVKSLSDMVLFIDQVDNDTVDIPSRPTPPKAWKQVTVGKDKRNGKKWDKWVAASIPEGELPDTYDRQFAERSYECTQALRTYKLTKAYKHKLPFTDTTGIGYHLNSYYYRQEQIAERQEETLADLEAQLSKLGITRSLHSSYTPQWEYVSPKMDHYTPNYRKVLRPPKYGG